MEFHQVRYFLALATTLHFTRAAEMCNVSQPALTRAIQQLEFELGGPLVSRERRLTHLTELGQRVLPVLQDCYKNALAAKAVARAEDENAALRLAIVGSVDLERLAGPLGQIIADFPHAEIAVMRGSNEEILEYLKSGEASLAVSDLDLGTWERLDSWLIDREPYALVANRFHRIADDGPVSLATLVKERLICLPYCSLAHELIDMAEQDEQANPRVCQVDSLADIFTLLKLNAGVAVLPRTLELPESLVRVNSNGIGLEHDTRLYAVAGRRRGRPAQAFVNYFANRSAAPRSRKPEARVMVSRCSTEPPVAQAA